MIKIFLILYIITIFFSDRAKQRQNTTQQQYLEMLEFFEKNQSLATNNSNTSGEGKVDSENLWKDLTATLNSLGPPSRDVKEWKRVLIINNNYNTHYLIINKYITGLERL